jgi:hypothetical protein
MSVIDSTEIRKRLMSAQEAENVTGVSSERLLELAQAGYAPCVRIDGGVPLFFKKDICSYVNRELTTIQEGKPHPRVAIMNRTAPSATFEELPEELHPMQEYLRRWGSEFIPPCVYFLCAGKQIVYVGQSVNLAARISIHYREKAGLFDRAFFLPVPKEQLNDIEMAFIAALNPPLNGTPGNGGKPSADGGVRPLKEGQVEILGRYKVLGVLSKHHLVDGFGRDVSESRPTAEENANAPA